MPNFLVQTQAVEDYLKTIYELQEHSGRVSTTALADRLGVAPASVTGMVKKLAEMRLLRHEPYHGVELTDAGKKIALEVIRHHRLVESYLAEALGVPWDKVHEEADRWEHVLSEEMEDLMAAKLGHPTTDPHGAPIPARDGTMPQSDLRRLSDLEPGEHAIIAEVSDHDPEMLRYLGEMGLFPRAALSVVSTAPFDGPVTVKINGDQHALGREVANHILVKAGPNP
jgi:DtxR family Mn-dependent transcriptional regulator